IETFILTARASRASLKCTREWLYRRTATAPRNGSEIALTGAEVDRWRRLRTVIAPMEHLDGTATAPRLCFSDRYSTEGGCAQFAASPPALLHIGAHCRSLEQLARIR